MALISELLANRREKKRSPRVKRPDEDLTVDEYIKRLDARERRAELKRYKSCKVLIDALDKVELATTNEALLFTRIVDFFERRHWLPDSYRRMLRELARGRRYADVTSVEVDVYGLY